MQQTPEQRPTPERRRSPACDRTPQAAGSWPTAAGRAERRRLWEQIAAQGLDQPRAAALWSALGLPAGARLAVALSGGADSVLLLHLAAARGGAPCAVHARHRLRGRASQADAAFCRRLCRSLGLRLLAPGAPLAPGPGLEQRARSARRRAMERALARLEASEPAAAAPRFLALGHQAQDRAETVLWRWLRGNDLASLALDPPAGGSELGGWRLIRPLADLSRAEVRALAARLGLEWREDHSNEEPLAARNRLRHWLWPTRGDGPGAAAQEALERLSQAALEFERALAPRLPALRFEIAPWSPAVAGSPPALVLAQAPLRGLPPFARERCLRALLWSALGREPGARHLASLAQALGCGAPLEIGLPGGWLLVAESERVLLLPPHPPLPAGERTWDLAGPLNLGPGRALAPGDTLLPGERQPAPPSLRWRRAELGLRLPLPRGRRGTLAELARDAGIPAAARPRLVLLLDERGPRAVPGLWHREPEPVPTPPAVRSEPWSGDRAGPSG
jgi:tRNA(Ile)-lysidine synthase